MSGAHTRIKLCGMTRAEDVELAVALGVDYIGLVFAGGSPRHLALAQAQPLRALVPASVGVVALVMDAPRAEVEAIASTLRPDCLQFHGSEEDRFCASFGMPYWKAIAMGDGADPALAMARYPSARGFVLDGHGAGEAGGSGRSFDWTRWPRDQHRPVLLAGGLSAHNVALALRTARPWGVDVSSGIEQAPGAKDAAHMRAFVAAVRAHDAAS